jgi:hypothetical protein
MANLSHGLSSLATAAAQFAGYEHIASGFQTQNPSESESEHDFVDDVVHSRGPESAAVERARSNLVAKWFVLICPRGKPLGVCVGRVQSLSLLCPGLRARKAYCVPQPPRWHSRDSLGGKETNTESAIEKSALPLLAVARRGLFAGGLLLTKTSLLSLFLGDLKAERQL